MFVEFNVIFITVTDIYFRLSYQPWSEGKIRILKSERQYYPAIAKSTGVRASVSRTGEGYVP